MAAMTQPTRSNSPSRSVHIARRGVLYSLVLCAAILLLGGVGFWALDPRVHTISDGLWLAFTTAATVGYGDLVPSTHASRGFAVVVVLLGLAVLSLATASLAAIFVERDVSGEVADEEQHLERELRLQMRQELRAELRTLHEEIAQLRDEVRRLHAPKEPPRGES